jgi:hypothetical protein
VYQLVLHKNLDFNKPCFSPQAQDLISRLLVRNPRHRLCDPETIRCHPFFHSIDWSLVIARKVPPPVVPDLDANDTKYFHREFTAEWAALDAADRLDDETCGKVSLRFSNFVHVRDAKPAETTGVESPQGSLVNLNSPVVQVSPKSFIGLWHLISLELRAADGRVAYPWGGDVIGLLIYEESGVYQLQLSPRRRYLFNNPACFFKATAQEIADAFASYAASFGKYVMAPGTNYIDHFPESSLCPNAAGNGMRERRFFQLNNRTLTLVTPTLEVEPGVRARIALQWQRYEGKL